jgi:hypothetical protein
MCLQLDKPSAVSERLIKSITKGDCLDDTSTLNPLVYTPILYSNAENIVIIILSNTLAILNVF